jgi:hypothetical protein
LGASQRAKAAFGLPRATTHISSLMVKENEASAVIRVGQLLNSTTTYIPKAYLPTCFICPSRNRQCYDFPFFGVVTVYADGVDELFIFFWCPWSSK